MPADQTSVPILRTKLHRPTVSPDIVRRQALHERLDANSDVPLVLVSAPPGYGKSILVSQWVEHADAKSAWLSLDENDNDLRVFLGYFVSAIRRVRPDACRSILSPLQADNLPSIRDLVRLLSNDLQGLDQPITLVLDDYHCIRDLAVHELLDELLRHPPRTLHLVLITRRDPPLSLRRFHARSMMTEIRMAELRFQESETAVLLNRHIGRTPNREALAALHSATEGWPLGVRMAAQAIGDTSDGRDLLAVLESRSRDIHDYLVGETIAAHSPEVVECLCRLSIVDRYCAPLGRALCGSRFESFALETGSEGSGLMSIDLDAQGEWQRFHHLFQSALRHRLERMLSPEKIGALHRRASDWFEEQGLYEEAIRHALKGGDPTRAAQVIAWNRHDLMDRERWADLHRWLGLLRHSVPQEFPELLITRAWSRQRRGQYSDLPALLDKAETALKDRGPEGSGASPVYGEIQVIRSFLYFGMSEVDLARSAAEEAVAGLSPTDGAVWAFGVLMRSASIQARGDVNKARELLLVAREVEGVSAGADSLLLNGLCVVDWMAGDLAGLDSAATQLLDLGRSNDLAESISFATYYLGISAYLRNDLSAIDRWLTPMVHQRQITHDVYFVHSSFVIALASLAKGRTAEAARISESVVQRALELGAVHLHSLAKAFEAELHLRQGKVAKAAAWSADFDPSSPLTAFRFFIPHLTFAKVLIAQNTDESRQQARALLDRLQGLFEATHNTRVLTDVLALQALLRHRAGDDKASLAALARSISLGQPAGIIRPFVDMGAELAIMLNRLDVDEARLHYAGRILAAFREDATGETLRPEQQVARSAPSDKGGQLDPLSKRELEVLSLLARGLTNKEIGKMLFISTGTVKRHTHNIYGKLSVSSRLEAVTKAMGLGVLKSG